VKGPSSKREDSLVKDVLQRSLCKSLLAASPVVLDNKRPAAALATPDVPVMAMADDVGRRPLRSILHNSGSSDTNLCDAVVSEKLRDTDSGSKKKNTR